MKFEKKRTQTCGILLSLGVSLAAPEHAAASSMTISNLVASPISASLTELDLPLSGPALTLFKRAQVAHQEGKSNEALELAREVHRLRPDVVEVKNFLAQVEKGVRKTKIEPKLDDKDGAKIVSKKESRKLQKNEPNSSSRPVMAATSKASKPLAMQKRDSRATISTAKLAVQTTQVSENSVPVPISKEQESALAYARLALEAAGKNELETALAKVASSIKIEPKVFPYRLMQIEFLKRLRGEQDAMRVAQEALDLPVTEDTQIFAYSILQVLNAVHQQLTGQYNAKEYLKALRSQPEQAKDDPAWRQLRFIVADAALAAQDPATVLQALPQANEHDIEWTERRSLAKFNTQHLTLQRPNLQCVVDNFGPFCSLFAQERPSRRLAAAAVHAAAEQQTDLAKDLFELALQLNPNDRSVIVQRDALHRKLALPIAQAAYQAVAKNDLAGAQALLVQAIAYAPEVMSYRLLYIETLLGVKDLKTAELAASAASQVDDEDPIPLLLHGYILQALGQWNRARSIYVKLLERTSDTEEDMRKLRLYIADAANAAQDFSLAHTSLAPLAADDAQAQWRRSILVYSKEHSTRAWPLEAPFLDCRTTPYGTTCSAGPAETAQKNLLTMVFDALANKRDTDALKLARQFAYLGTSKGTNEDANQRVLAYVLQRLGQHDEANKVKEKLSKDGPELGFAYMAALAGAPQLALAAFKEIDDHGKLPAQALQNAAFTAVNAKETPLAISYFKRSIDAATEGKVNLNAQEMFDVRRAISNLEQDWGVLAAASYRGSSILNGVPNQRIIQGDSLYTGVEAYKRLPNVSLAGQPLDIYFRLAGTPYSSDTETRDLLNAQSFSGKPATGRDTLQATVGVRYQPFTTYGIVASFERQHAVGSALKSDWLFRIGHSYAQGTDLRVGKAPWFSQQTFAEAGTYLNSHLRYLSSEWQAGWSMLATDLTGTQTVWWPHAVVAADYSSAFAEPWAVGAGIGLNLRYWFRGDHYHAPRSNLDFSIQYRHKLMQDARAKGWVVRSVLKY